MPRLFYFLIFTLLSTVFTIQTLLAQKSHPHIVSTYNMKVELDTVNKLLHGITQLTYTNPSTDTIQDLHFHMYYNAFKNDQSTFFAEGGLPEFLTSNIDKVCGWSYSHIENIADAQGNILEDLTYIQPDDDNLQDQTVLKVGLKSPILPNQTTMFDFEWTAKIPNTMVRTGYNKDFYFFAQWFPKLGVYEPAGMRYATSGAWNCHQYHSVGEYYADFSDYTVALTVPNNCVVASSGELISKTDGYKSSTWTFQGNNIIDFAWSASPHYVITEDAYANTKIKLYSYPYKQHLAGRYLPTIKFCMEYLNKHLGPYPYSTLSIIDPPIHGLFVGGMEYPTLVTSLSFNFFPEGFRTPETLVVHEFIHQYFMQMVATNETEEPWMDEGFTTYWECRILDALFSSTSSMIDQAGITIGSTEYNRFEFLSSPYKSTLPNSHIGWKQSHNTYGPISYNKTAIWLQTMQGLLGDELMNQIWTTYFKTWQFKHPARQDFIDVVNLVVSQYPNTPYSEGMDWYFDQVLYGTASCDYSIVNIQNDFLTTKQGFFENQEDCITKEDSIGVYSCTISIENSGDLKLPQLIVVNMEDGSSKSFDWDGTTPFHRINFRSKSKVTSAILDPDLLLKIDDNFLNNSRTAKANTFSITKFFASIVADFQHLFLSTSILI